jgi:hypothetical protein
MCRIYCKEANIVAKNSIQFDAVHVGTGYVWDDGTDRWKKRPDGYKPQRMEKGTKLKFSVTYPLTTTKNIELDLEGGWTIGQFIEAVIKAYKDIYDEEHRAVGDPGHIPGMLNRATSAGPYGIWGHDLNDLVLSGAQKDANGYWQLDISS